MIYTAFTIRSSSCVGEDRRKGRRKRKEKGERERLRRINKDRKAKYIGIDKPQ